MRAGEKRIGFLSFGHWQPIPGSQVRTGRDALVQSVERLDGRDFAGRDRRAEFRKRKGADVHSGRQRLFDYLRYDEQAVGSTRGIRQRFL